jgi:hypothetical protein
VLSEEGVRNRDGCRSHDRVEEAIMASGKRDVVHPDVSRSKQRDTITISHSSEAIMIRGAANHGIPGRYAVMDMDSVDDDVADELDGEASTVSNVDLVPTPVDGLVAVHDELLLQSNGHVGVEDDPEWLILDDGIAKSSGFRIDGVVI